MYAPFPPRDHHECVATETPPGTAQFALPASRKLGWMPAAACARLGPPLRAQAPLSGLRILLPVRLPGRGRRSHKGRSVRPAGPSTRRSPVCPLPSSATSALISPLFRSARSCRSRIFAAAWAFIACHWFCEWSSACPASMAESDWRFRDWLTCSTRAVIFWLVSRLACSTDSLSHRPPAARRRAPGSVA